MPFIERYAACTTWGLRLGGAIYPRDHRPRDQMNQIYSRGSLLRDKHTQIVANRTILSNLVTKISSISRKQGGVMPFVERYACLHDLGSAPWRR